MKKTFIIITTLLLSSQLMADNYYYPKSEQDCIDRNMKPINTPSGSLICSDDKDTQSVNSKKTSRPFFNLGSRTKIRGYANIKTWNGSGTNTYTNSNDETISTNTKSKNMTLTIGTKKTEFSYNQMDYKKNGESSKTIKSLDYSFVYKANMRVIYPYIKAGINLWNSEYKFAKVANYGLGVMIPIKKHFGIDLAYQGRFIIHGDSNGRSDEFDSMSGLSIGLSLLF